MKPTSTKNNIYNFTRTPPPTANQQPKIITNNVVQKPVTALKIPQEITTKITQETTTKVPQETTTKVPQETTTTKVTQETSPVKQTQEENTRIQSSTAEEEAYNRMFIYPPYADESTYYSPPIVYNSQTVPNNVTPMSPPVAVNVPTQQQNQVEQNQQRNIIVLLIGLVLSLLGFVLIFIFGFVLILMIIKK